MYVEKLFNPITFYSLYRLKKEAIRMKKTSKTQVKDTRYRKLLKDRAIFGMETSFEVWVIKKNVEL